MPGGAAGQACGEARRVTAGPVGGAHRLDLAARPQPVQRAVDEVDVVDERAQEDVAVDADGERVVGPDGAAHLLGCGGAPRGEHPLGHVVAAHHAAPRDEGLARQPRVVGDDLDEAQGIRARGQGVEETPRTRRRSASCSPPGPRDRSRRDAGRSLRRRRGRATGASRRGRAARDRARRGRPPRAWRSASTRRARRGAPRRASPSSRCTHAPAHAGRRARRPRWG